MVKSNSILWIILLYLGVFFVVAFIVLKEVWTPISGNEVSFKNFVIYNYTLNIIVYIFKFLLLFLFFKLVLLVFDIEKKIPLLKILILAEMVYILVLKGYLLIYYYLIDSNITTEFYSTYKSKASMLSLLPKDFNTFKHIIGFVTIFDVVYIVFLMFMLSKELKISFYKSFKTMGLSYLALLLFFGAIKTFMSL